MEHILEAANLARQSDDDPTGFHGTPEDILARVTAGGGGYAE